MVFSQIKSNLAALVLPVIGGLFIFYLGYHGLYGDNGLLRYFQLQQQMERYEYELALIKEERELLIHRTAGLKRSSLDLDLINERARTVLGYAHPDDLVIFYPLSTPETTEVLP